MPWNLTNCEDEPIHIPGSIQPHGVLIALDAETQTITHLSENAAELLEVSPRLLLGQRLDAIEVVQAGFPLASMLRADHFTMGRPIYHATWRRPHHGAGWDAITHRNQSHLFLEFERSPKPIDNLITDLHHHLQAVLAQIEHARTVIGMAELVSSGVQHITSFDRVMVYRFDESWNGHVIAETRRDDLEPFLGLHYPASDIPRQARELYTRNWLRFIPDRDYRPCGLLAAPPADRPPLDLSHSVLRSVSPIHLEYLQNMGVGASMSISILNGEKLWGLIACHHYSPKFVPYDVRKASELLGHFVSLQLTHVEAAEAQSEKSRLHCLRPKLMEKLSSNGDFAKSFLEGSPNLLEFIHCDGVACVLDQKVSRLGLTPNEFDILNLSEWIQSRGDDVFATDCLSTEFGTRILSPVAAGVLSVRMGHKRKLQLLWFRAEQTRTVDWAGDPRKANLEQPDAERLSPRGSFALWQEVVKGRSQPWTPDELDAAQQLRSDLVRAMLKRAEALADEHDELRLISADQEKAVDAERTARLELERLNRVKDEFVAVLSHELRTPLNSILGWTQLLKLTGQTAEIDVRQGLDVIENNARAQATMIDDLLDINRIMSGKLRLDLEDVDLAKIIAGVIDSVAAGAQSKQLRIEKLLDQMVGTCLTGDPNRLRQIAWNLLSNAVKFTPKNGKIQVILRRVDSHVEFSVTDTGVGIQRDFLPYVFDRYRQADASSSRQHGGLGLGLSITRNLVEMHGGSISVTSAGEGQGATFVVALPIRVVTSQSPGVDQQTDGGLALQLPSIVLTDVVVLVVDDEFDARELIRRGLEANGASVLCAASAQEALLNVGKQHFDLVISDVGMPGHDGYWFIRNLRNFETQTARTRLCTIALTAYARPEDRRKALMAGFNMHLTKPVDIAELIAVVASLTNRIPPLADD